MAQIPLFILYTSSYLVLRAVPCIIVIIILQIRNWDSEKLSNLFRTTLPANDKAMIDVSTYFKHYAVFLKCSILPGFKDYFYI